MNICVYGASSNRIDKMYMEKTEELGYELGKRNHNLIFGAGANGLMGAIARGVYKGGGKIVGVVPDFFKVDGVFFEHCDELIYTKTMRERKQIMEDRSDAYIMTPGGMGTFDEFFEMMTLKQLARHAKPITVFNVGGYYDKMFEFFEYSVSQGFMRDIIRVLYEPFDDPKALLDYIENYKGTLTVYKDLK